MIRSVCIITFLVNSISVAMMAQDLLASGPMVGYSAMREVSLWAQTTSAAEVMIEYWTSDAPDIKYKTDPVITKKSTAYTAHLTADHVEPSTTYVYRLWINGEIVVRPYPLSFKTQSLWQFRTDPPPFKFVAGSCFYVNEEAYDRPGEPYGGNIEILDAIRKEQPDFMMWLGDNVYLREADYDSRTGILKRYSQMRALDELQPLLGSMSHYAIWDDHDYGPNDSDATYWGKEMTEDAFKLFWSNPNYNLTKLGGITGRFSWNDCDFFLLDNRYHRTIAAIDGQILGKEQVDWLIASLRKSRAPFKFICVGGQTISDARIYENHANYKDERRRIIDLLDQYDIHGVVFIGGDRHSSEITRLVTDKGNVYYDVTSSALTAKTYDHLDEPNSYRVDGSMISVNNYAVVSVTGPRKSRQLSLTFKDKAGAELYSYDVVFPEFKSKKKH